MKPEFAPIVKKEPTLNQRKIWSHITKASSDTRLRAKPQLSVLLANLREDTIPETTEGLVAAYVRNARGLKPNTRTTGASALRTWLRNEFRDIDPLTLNIRAR